MKQDKKNDAIGIATSIGIHGLILLLFVFLAAWTIPNPPPPGPPGVEINIGFVDEGMGDILDQNIPTQEEITEQEMQEEVKPEDIVQDQEVVTSDVESPVAAEKKDEIKKEEVKVKEEKKTEKKAEADTKNLFPNKNQNTVSNGNTDKKGDQGNPDGTPDSRNLYPGNPGGGGGGGNGTGASLDLPGWKFEKNPNRPDPTSEFGYVSFEFYVDGDGEVIPGTIKKIGGANFTPSEDNFYKRQLQEEVSFEPKSNTRPAARTRGTYRFQIKTK
jgi:protein TonB